MKPHIVRSIVLGTFAFVVGLGSVLHAQAQNPIAPYPGMAPIDKYMIADRNDEIALARSAAPVSIARDAEVLVLGRHGYETAVKGKNGFVCAVERSWMSPFDSPEYWNPKIRGPLCFNPPASRSILPITYMRTEMAMAGKSKTQIMEGTRTAYEKKELPALEPGAMAYMMSKNAYLTDHGGHNIAHVMLYTPHMDPAVWGANLPGSPIMVQLQFEGVEPIDVLIVPVGKWSDGTGASVM